MRKISVNFGPDARLSFIIAILNLRLSINGAIHRINSIISNFLVQEDQYFMLANNLYFSYDKVPCIEIVCQFQFCFGFGRHEDWSAAIHCFVAQQVLLLESIYNIAAHFVSKDAAIAWDSKWDALKIDRSPCHLD